MTRAQIHRSRYSLINLTAQRKGFRLEQGTGGAWKLISQKSGTTVTAAGDTLDEIAAFLMTRMLSG